MIELPSAQTPATGKTLYWGQLPGAARSMAIAALAKQQAEPYLLITPDTATAYQIQQELNFFAEELVVKLLPDWETLPYDNFSPHEDIISERLRTLSELPAMSSGILVAPIATLMQKIAPPDYIQANSLQLKVGQILDLAEIRRQLESAAYQNVSTVYQHGEYALRGSILDIFPMGSEQPYRIDLLDNEIDSLRSFDPDSQRSLESCQVIDLLPGREFPLDENGITQFRRNWHERFEVDHRQCTLYQDVSDGLAPAGIEYYLKLFFDDTATLFDYLPARSVCIMLEGIEEAANHHWQDIKQRHEQRCGDIRRPVLAPQEIFQTVAELFSELKNYPRIAIQQSALDDCGSHGQNFPFSTPPMLNIESKDSDPIKALRDYAQGKRLLICSESLGRREALIELLSRHQLRPHEVNSWADYAQQDHALAITVGPLDDGINLLQPQAFAIISEAQLFGKRVSQNRRRKKAVSNADQVIKNLAELRIGAPVVHSDHGVGRYLGLQTLEIDGEANEFLHLEYADEAKLYVPVGSLQLISRYSGADDERAPLHRLGSEQWSKAKRKAAERIRDVAAELLDIYARREARGGRAFKATADDYLQFSNAFPFEETPDQEQAIDAVVADLQSEKSMDRLVCGDVGFGKTEVAVRAAFVAIQGGSQVALLVPTTLLAQQHFESFRDRFADWPVNIEVLSRFRSASEQTAIIRDVAAGKVDILIGTHKLLSKEIQYDDLGLVIIDEEHRFGVRQKEVLKNLRAEVDILTLTATPIPRTLNMSMAGIRDLSIIATPPPRRLSVKTFVRESDTALIKEAVLREVSRGGQVYYLHNDVKSMEKSARELQELLPDIRIGIGHGQMPERELEQVMTDFYHQRHNVLLCSTIIETGIDIPNANTIIIERADKFGLAQLHQLRGRVGRSHHQAYAYLLTPPSKQLTRDAEKRLLAITEADTLGAGFTLATHDMEIRGAGELLGEDQSGQIHSIGFTLYMEMLDRAVNAIKQGKMVDLESGGDQQIEVNLRLPALIPDEFIADVQSRLMLYKRVASANSSDALRELQVEMIDRFGLLPEPTKNLFRCAEIRLTASQLGLQKVEMSAIGGRIEFTADTRVEPLTLVQLVQSSNNAFKFDGATALRFKQPSKTTEERFQFIEELLVTLDPGDKNCDINQAI